MWIFCGEEQVFVSINKGVMGMSPSKKKSFAQFPCFYCNSLSCLFLVSLSPLIQLLIQSLAAVKEDLTTCSQKGNLGFYLLPPPSPIPFSHPQPGKNTGVGCHILLQGIFLTQGLNLHLLCLLHWQENFFMLHQLESPPQCHVPSKS